MHKPRSGHLRLCRRVGTTKILARCMRSCPRTAALGTAHHTYTTHGHACPSQADRLTFHDLDESELSEGA